MLGVDKDTSVERERYSQTTPMELRLCELVYSVILVLVG